MTAFRLLVTEPLDGALNMALDEALHLMAEEGLERLAVTEGGRLLGVLPREGLVRRLAEDELREEPVPGETP